MAQSAPPEKEHVMNLPNKLTLARIVMIPLCVTLICLHAYPWAAAVFALAAVTDFLDGYLARKNHQVTVFGKFADPVADKLLVLTAMIALTAQSLLPAWAVCVVAARELAVDGLRLVAAGRQNVVAASILGKIKTNLQLLCVLSALLFLPHAVTMTLTVAMAVMTLVSGADYFYKLRDVWKENDA